MNPVFFAANQRRKQYCVYLCLIQASQGLEQIAQVTPNAVKVLQQDLLWFAITRIYTEIFFTFNFKIEFTLPFFFLVAISQSHFAILLSYLMLS